MVSTSFRQPGFAILSFMLLLVTLLALLAAHVMLSMQERLLASADAVRARQAAASADSALGYGAAYYLASGADRNGDGQVDGDTNSGLLAGSQAGLGWQVRFCAASVVRADCPVPPLLGPLRLLAQGLSADGRVRQLATVRVASRPLLPAVPGQALLLGGVQGALPQLSADNLASPDEQRALAVLAATPDEVFLRVLGRPLLAMQTVADRRLQATRTVLRWPEAARVVFVKVPSGEVAQLEAGSLGSPQQPVLLLADGAVQLPAGSTLYGMLVAQQVLLGPGARVEGAVACGLLQDSALAEIYFRPELLSRLAALPIRGLIAGSWRDWRG